MIKKPTYEELEKKVQAFEQAEFERQLAERSLRDNEERFRLVYQHMAVGIAQVSPEFRIEGANQAYCSMLGYREKELIGKHLRDITHSESWEENLRKQSQLVEGEIDHYRMEKRYIHKSGGVIHGILNTNLVRDNQGKPLYCLGSVLDITEHKRTHEALRKTAETLQLIIECSPAAIISLDRDTNVTMWNTAAERIFGWKKEEVMGKPYPAVPEDKQAEFRLILRQQLNGDGLTGEVLRRRRKDGSQFYVSASTGPLRNTNGDIIGLLSIMTDITKRKHAEDALFESEERFRNLIEGSIQGICIHKDLRPVFVNRAFADIHGYTPNEILELGTLLPLFSPLEHARLAGYKNNRMRGKDAPIKYEYQGVRKDGTVIWVENRVMRVVWKKDAAIQMTIFDISDRKKAEKMLRQSEERLKIAGGLAYDLIYEWIIADDKLEWFGNIEKKLGYDHNEIPRTIEGWLKLIHPEDSVRLKDAVELHSTSTAQIDYEYRVHHKDGSWKYWSDKALPILNNKGRPYKWIGVCTDITVSKEAARALRNSEERLKSIVDNAVVGIYQVTHKGKFLMVNSKLAQMFGYKSPEEFLASVKNIYQLYVHPEDRPTILEKIKARGFVDGVEIQFWNRDGQIVLTMVSVRAIEDKTEGTIYEGFMADITDRRRAEEALRESEEKLARSKKMESLGLLAGGVAHDLNNVLSGVVSYPELLLMDLPQNSKLREPIMTIQESGHRAVAIVQDLLTVARGVAITKEPLNLNDIVKDYLQSPEFKKLEQFHPTVTVKTNLQTDLLNTSGSHVHISKVVMNLVSNASEAVEDGGHITISTLNRYIDKPLRKYDDVKTGEYIVMAVSDDGSGISSDDLERIFEPFYTKKVMGRSGTGLGLAVVWNTLQDHKGYIDVTSDENGTTFELYFPTTRDEISDKDLPIPVRDYKGNGETILVVDDVESQREISCKMLDTLGYRTKAVCSGEEAVEYLKEHTVDLILLDMIMDPGINGRETYERIKKIHTNQKAIIVSGFAETDEVKEAQRLGAGKYVKKPFALEKIGYAVKEELGK